jgi:hypothetical protein
MQPWKRLNETMIYSGYRQLAKRLYEFHNHLRSGRLTDVATGYLGLDFLGCL